jgi:hypothetical protein
MEYIQMKLWNKVALVIATLIPAVFTYPVKEKGAYLLVKDVVWCGFVMRTKKTKISDMV